MDAKEAIEHMKEVRKVAFYVKEENKKDAETYGEHSYDLIDTAIKALEKQVPVKIRTEIEGIYEPYDDVPVGRKVNLYCGKCGKPLTAYHDYCYWCGQAIKNDKE